MTFVIYEIVDPRDNSPIYIGQTSSFDNRIKTHIENAKRKPPNIKTFNIRVYASKLYLNGHLIKIRPLHTVDTLEEALDEETKIIELISKKYPLLNRDKEHREIIKKHFTSEELKRYFHHRLK